MNIIQLKVGEEKELQFESLSTAGYMWNYSVDDELKLRIEKKSIIANAAAPRLSGKSNTEIFIMKALEKGSTVLHFYQYRNWEGKEKTIKTEAYSVVIN